MEHALILCEETGEQREVSIGDIEERLHRRAEAHSRRINAREDRKERILHLARSTQTQRVDDVFDGYPSAMQGHARQPRLCRQTHQGQASEAEFADHLAGRIEQVGVDCRRFDLRSLTSHRVNPNLRDMDVPKKVHRRTGIDPIAGLVAGFAATVALAGTYWDDSWHTDRGRDAFAIPPHLLIYGGVLLAALSTVGWAVSVWTAAPSGERIRATSGDPALTLACLGGIVTLASAPVDNFWHEAYGRDAVLWSPPHLLAVAGTLALSTGLLAGVRRAGGRVGRVARLVLAAAVIGALQVPVLEYDSDVPQFSTIWFLPMAAFGTCLAVALLDDLLPGRWHATRAAATYTVLRLGIAGTLWALGFSLSAVPPVVLSVAMAEGLRHVGPTARLALVGAVSPLFWWPVIWMEKGVAAQVPIQQLPSAVLLGGVAGLIVALLRGDWHVRQRCSRRAIALSVVVAWSATALLVSATPSSAHDPGQGEDYTAGQFTLRRAGGRALLALDLDRPCGELRAVRAVARRAGTARSGPLSLDDREPTGCRAIGSVDDLAPGQWFIYIELSKGRDGRIVEAWVPSKASGTTSSTRVLYVPATATSPVTRDLIGLVVLLVIAWLLAGCLRLARCSATEARLPAPT